MRIIFCLLLFFCGFLILYPHKGIVLILLSGALSALVLVTAALAGISLLPVLLGLVLLCMCTVWQQDDV